MLWEILTEVQRIYHNGHALCDGKYEWPTTDFHSEMFLFWNYEHTVKKHILNP